MKNLVVFAPDGLRDIVVVGDGGGYYDESKIIWDEENDGPIPDALMILVQNDVLSRVSPPRVVSRKSARLALLNADKLQLVQPAIDALAEPDKTFVQIEWDDSLTFERDSSTLQMIAGAIGISDEELDALFIAAAALE